MSKQFEKAKTLGERLVVLRESRSLTQEEFAEALNVSRQSVSNWENDKVKLDVAKAAEICRLFNVSMDELFLNKESAGIEVRQNETTLRKIALLVALTLAVILIVVGSVCLATQGDNETSSTITMGMSVLWCALILSGIVALGVVLYLFVKRK